MKKFNYNVTAKELANALDKKIRTGQRTLLAIRKFVNKVRHQLITVSDVAMYYKMTIEETLIFLKRKKGYT